MRGRLVYGAAAPPYVDAYTPPPTLPPQLPPSALADAIGREPGAVWPLADPGRRIVASLLDALCLVAALVPTVLVSLSIDRDAAPGALALVFMVSVLALAVYQSWLLATEGQTLAKRWLGLRVVRVEDQGNPGFVRAVLLRSVVSSIIGSFFSFLYTILDVSFMLFREDRRAVHDLLASTEVIDERVPY